jgi:hypothetical protein
VRLGEYSFQKIAFDGLEAVFKEFYSEEFKKLGDRQRSERVNKALLQLLQDHPDPCFLLRPVLDFVERIDQEKLLQHYTFTSFELWLNQSSGLSFEENLQVRGKIAGKWVPREEYQVLFPVGMGKVYEGTHFVTAHKSPDLDTTIASFWGWLDSFAAKVGTGLHLWNVPGGPPEGLIEMDMLFRDVFGQGIFTHLVKTKTSLSLTGNDLMTQKEMLKKKVGESVAHIHHDRDKKAVVVVSPTGYYLGDWRSTDFESARLILMLLNNCLRWFENNLHVNLISLFSQSKVHLKDLPKFAQSIFEFKIKDCDPALEYSKKEKDNLDQFLRVVLELENGLDASFEEFGKALSKLHLVDFSKVKNLLDSIEKAKIFDKSGNIVENRPLIFEQLGIVVQALHQAIQNVRAYMERLDVSLKIKTQVFGHSPKFVTVRADVEEIRSKMESHSYLTVNYPDHNHFYPVGIIYASDLRKNTLGTVSLRDFCNREEVTIPSYLEIISVIDHHKSSLSTLSPPLAIITDSQSSNAIVAELSFRINDRFSVSGMTLDEVKNHLKKFTPASLEKGEGKALSKLVHFQDILKRKSPFFVHPEREFVEYLHFLYGIIDDTDLLSKVSQRDIECVVHLLNRMKSLLMKKPVEIVSVEDIPIDKNFTKNAARRILQNEDMYSLYSKVYAFREKEIEKNLALAASGKPSTVFVDTKEQNGCCRVGQTKVFAKNRPAFMKHKDHIREVWLKGAQQLAIDKPEYDLHIHMVSTVVGADEVYRDSVESYTHKDEMWIWISPTDTAIEHLKRFLNAFQESPQIKKNSSELEVEFLGNNAEELSQIFTESFLPIAKKIASSKKIPIAVLYYKAGTLNSRKAMVSPFLPILNS